MKRTVNILGTKYSINVSNDKWFEENDCVGGCNGMAKVIMIASRSVCVDYDEESYKELFKVTLRHEILHAFFNESGLMDSACKTKGAWVHNEEMIDWFAIQFPKIFKIYEELDIV